VSAAWVFLPAQAFRGREIQIAAGETTGVHKGNGAQKIIGNPTNFL